MAFQYEYDAYQELNSQKLAKVIVTLFTLTLFLLGMMFVQDAERSTFIGVIILTGATFSFFSPYSYFNILGQKTFLNVYIKIGEEEVTYKLSPFRGQISFATKDIKEIRDDVNDVVFVLKDGSSYNLDMRKIMQVHKRTELILWITNYQKKLSRR